MSNSGYRYTACGLEIDSEFAISHLPKGRGHVQADLHISASSSLPLFEATITTPQWRASKDQVQLYGMDGESCICTAGSQVTFSGIPSNLDETCTLLGRALAVICMQRGKLVLHAAVVEKDGNAIAITGRSGAGKSTLTMDMIRRQFRVVADDIAVCDVTENAVIVQPLYPMTRRRATGEPPAGWKAIPGLGKHVSIDVPFCPEARALEQLIVLTVSSSSNAPIRIESLAEESRRAALESQIYRKGIARGLLGYNGLRKITERAARLLPISLARRPPDCDPVELADAITDYLKTHDQ